MKERITVSGLPDYFTKSIESSYLVRSIQEGQTHENKKRYYDVQLMDATGTIRGKIWEENMKDAHSRMSGTVATVSGMVVQSQTGTCQLLIRSMEPKDDYRMSDYIRGLSGDEAIRYRKLLWKYIESIKHPGYSALAGAVYSGIADLESLPATITGHHNYNGGYLVYTVGITCLVNHIVKSIATYDRHPDHSVDFMPDILTTAALLHATGTTSMLTAYPDSRRVASSIPLGAYDMTMKKITETAALHPEFELGETELNLLLHTIGCVYAQEERKPMLREALILKKAVELQCGLSMLDHFLAANEGKEGMIFDSVLGNYLYIKPETNKEETDG